MKNHKYLYLGTLSFFALSFMNIHLAVLGLICMALPVYLLLKDKKKTWCQSYCPRASLYMTLGKKRAKKGKNIPLSFIKGKLKYYVLAYFFVSLSIAALSTIQVARGNMPPMLIPRFLLIIPIPVSLPQLFTLSGFPIWFTHFSFRIFSMMTTTTVIGLILSYTYKPRTWCTICPINTISDLYIMDQKGKKISPAKRPA